MTRSKYITEHEPLLPVRISSDEREKLRHERCWIRTSFKTNYKNSLFVFSEETNGLEVLTGLWVTSSTAEERGGRGGGSAYSSIPRGDFKATRFLSCSLLNPPPLFWHYRNMSKPLCAQNREKIINNNCFQVKHLSVCLCKCDIPDNVILSMNIYPNSWALSWSIIFSHTVYILFSHVCPVLTVSLLISLCSCRT